MKKERSTKVDVVPTGPLDRPPRLYQLLPPSLLVWAPYLQKRCHVLLRGETLAALYVLLLLCWKCDGKPLPLHRAGHLRPLATALPQLRLPVAIVLLPAAEPRVAHSLHWSRVPAWCIPAAARPGTGCPCGAPAASVSVAVSQAAGALRCVSRAATWSSVSLSRVSGPLPRASESLLRGLLLRGVWCLLLVSGPIRRAAATLHRTGTEPHRASGTPRRALRWASRAEPVRNWFTTPRGSRLFAFLAAAPV
jgi:hypothetical protein